MPKNLSAIKRSHSSSRNCQRNKIYKSIIKTFTKKYLSHISSQETNIDDCAVSLRLVYQKIDKAVKRGVWHKNKGARKKARLVKLLQNI